MYEPGIRKEKITMEGTMEKIVNFVSKTRFSDLPKYVIHEMKRVILDSIGCAITGHSTDRGRIAVELARKLGGPFESTIIGTNNKVSCVNAAFANGELMNALDFDAFSSQGIHDVPILISALLPLGERVGASGQNLILSTALALEISGRLKTAVKGIHDPGPNSNKMLWPEVAGYSHASLGVAAGATKLLELNQEQIANGIGIAGYICLPSTSRKKMETTPIRMIKYGPSGWGAQAGVTSALLAEMGYTGDTDLFEGEYGFWKYTGSNKGEWNTQKVIKELGTKWLAPQIFYKQYPGGL